MTSKMKKKIATVIITVDLHCCTCSKKIKKTLCKLQNRFNIESIVYDEKKNTITVSGPFNPDCFIKKLRCLACKVIICVQIKPKPKPDKPPPPPPPPPKVEVEVNLDVCVFPPPG
ncbi:protein PYRICULARIA ORYZAE RESISTANCE 21-like isoform X2 [Musa acuminata AAA Group]|uniref:protein PYRICULARIA ORYZAE RESISTANCE 21-like isoform X2 n=1 Tax=Musa acuminata AAA Group TaxID=214697 RepID=UPI0031D19233